MDPRILDPAAPVVFFPVRHHSPAAARLVNRLIRELKPAAVLIEGPSDFNDQIGQLALPHELPIAIYSFLKADPGTTPKRGQHARSAFYPFCVYSPEWQALQTAFSLGIHVRFIDLPWRELVGSRDLASHRYADGELRQSGYVATLAARLGVEGLDEIWDLLAEVEPDLSLETYLERCHTFCYHVRLTDPVPVSDRCREEFMARQIAQVYSECSPGPLVVVTGGFHSYALFARHLGLAFEEDLLPPPEPQQAEATAGIALTPYSYERLDALLGYEAGMPGPGFYHRVWCDREAGKAGTTCERLLMDVARSLRRSHQTASSADLIAALTMARGLAALRGHPEVWRRDLVDAIVGALVKDELATGGRHPLLTAVQAVFRGTERGRLAQGTTLPALVQDIQVQMEAHDLRLPVVPRNLSLDLSSHSDRLRSRFLHRLRVLNIAGIVRTGGTDWVGRGDLADLGETWQLVWKPEFEAGCIEAALYGSTLVEASRSRLRQLSAEVERSAEGSALLVLDACLMGLDELGAELAWQLVQSVRQDNDFLSTSAALGHLLYLYRYDSVLQAARVIDLGAVLGETFWRSLWLLESLGHTGSGDRKLLTGIALILETFERCASRLDFSRQAFIEPLTRTAASPSQGPLVRGAVLGVLWVLGEAGLERLLAQVRLFYAPDRLGDFLGGLFYLAREAVQREDSLVLAIDAVIAAYGEEEFLEALPALRLAFSYFTPREKHHLTRTLLAALGLEDTPALAPLEVSADQAARALAIEARLFAALEHYGLETS